MKNIIGIFIFFIAFLGNAKTQVGQFPELIAVPDAAKIVKEQLVGISTQISDILGNGGQVEEPLQYKHDLFKAVLEVLEANQPGTTTFGALSSQCNFKNLKADDEAYQDFGAGTWDEQMSELIKLVTK